MGSPDSATTSGCRVNLMGGFRMRSHDRVVELPLGAQRLVAYLALEELLGDAGPRGRDAVAGQPAPPGGRELPHRAVAAARRRLAMALSGLNRVGWL